MTDSPERRVIVIEKDGGIVISIAEDQCVACAQALRAESLSAPCAKGDKARRGVISSAVGTVFICTNEKDFVASSRKFKKELEFFSNSLGRIIQLENEIVKREVNKTRRLLHNLISLNAHSLQDLYSVISQEELSDVKFGKDQKALIGSKLRASPKDAAEIFLRALKNAGAVKSELAVFRKLYESSPQLSVQHHVAHRVVLNVANYFFQDFADIPVRLVLEPSVASWRFDYESVQVAIYHIFDNAAKYALPGSELRIVFKEGRTFDIQFFMTSLYGDLEDQKIVASDGQSGKQSKLLGRAGQGLGLGMVNDLMLLNNGSLEIEWGEKLPLAADMPLDSLRYARNTFSLRFKPLA